MSAFIGEIAALFTSLCFAATATFFTLAGEQVGSVVVNRTRLVFAVLLLGVTHWIVLGHPFPLDAAPERWLWLGLSGVIGLAIGDAFLFQAFLWVGPRLTMLMMSLAPVITALLGWLFLDERLNAWQMVGIGVALGGTAWVIAEQNPANGDRAPNRHFGRGLLFGLGAATGQAVGLILAKNGLAGGFPALSGNLIRMMTATVVLWTVALLQGQAHPTVARLRAHPQALKLLALGAIVGPFVGVWASLFAIQHALVGVASTLMSLTPVWLLPIGWLVFRERFGRQAILGTLLAILGVAILFLA